MLAACGELGYQIDTALFANVGDDSEHPATISLPIPVRMSNGAPGTRKIRVVGRWLREHGATGQDPATVCVARR